MGYCDICGERTFTNTCNQCGESFCEDHMLPENHHCPSVISEKAASGWFEDGDREVLIGEQVSDDEAELDESDATGGTGGEGGPRAEQQENHNTRRGSNDSGTNSGETESDTDEQEDTKNITVTESEREETVSLDGEGAKYGRPDEIGVNEKDASSSSIMKKASGTVNTALLELVNRVRDIVRSGLRRLWRGVRMTLRAIAVVVVWASSAWGGWLWLNNAPKSRFAVVALAGIGGYILLKMTNFSR